jgi:CubicO group peptidase (beta-lactamase class C family)
MMKTLKILAAFLAGIIILSCPGCSEEPVQDFSYNIPTTSVGEPLENLQQFEQRLESLRKQLNIPAISAAIVKNRQIVWAQGFGYADIEKNIKATQYTSYHLASITKSIAATIIMQLVEEGRLNLMSLLSEFGIQLDNSDTVRVVHLLTHTSKGIPGTVFEYDGSRFSLLDQVVEQVSGQSFAELVLERIVKPLDLKNTAPNLWDIEACNLWNLNREQFEQNMAKAYWPDGQTRILYERYFGTAAGLISSVIDLAKYSIAIDDNILVSRETQELQYTPEIFITDSTTAYGLGWFIQKYQGVKIIWHGGCWTGTSGFLVKVPEKDLAFMVLGNTNMLQMSYPQMRNDGDVTRSTVVMEFLLNFVFGDAKLPDFSINNIN